MAEPDQIADYERVICIPLDVVQAMVRLLEEDHAAWPMDGQRYVLQALRAELVRIEAEHTDGQAEAQ